MSRAYGYDRFGGPESEMFFDEPRPKPGPDQLLVKVRAAGVNPADWKRRSGMSGVKKSGGVFDRPVGLGREAAGIVEEVATSSGIFAVGDEVFGQVDEGGGGAFVEYALLASEISARKPAGVTFLDAATLPIAAATAYDGIKQLDLSVGDTLLIVGIGGGVGLAAAQIATHHGINVLGTASASKRALVESIGAAHVTYGEEGVATRVRAAAPNGVDGLFDLVGGEALASLAGLLSNKSKLISGADGTAARKLGGDSVLRARNREVLEAVAQLVEQGALNPFVSKVLPFNRAGEALRLVEEGHATGKIVLEIS